MTATTTDFELAARVAQLYYTYARAVDEGDIETLTRIAMEDVQITRVNGTSEGREAFLDVYRAQNASSVECCKHVITNIQATRDPDGSILARAYFEATMFDPDGTRRVIGQYADSLIEDDGELKLTHKRITVERVLHLPKASEQWRGIEASVPAD